jgi:hypothetical protein
MLGFMHDNKLEPVIMIPAQYCVHELYWINSRQCKVLKLACGATQSLHIVTTWHNRSHIRLWIFYSEKSNHWTLLLPISKPSIWGHITCAAEGCNLWGKDKQQTSSVWLLTYTTPKYIAVYQSKGHMDPLYIKTNQNPKPSLKVAHPSISPWWYLIQNLYSNYERGSITCKMDLCLNKA